MDKGASVPDRATAAAQSNPQAVSSIAGIPSALRLALIPFIEAARKGSWTHDAVKAASLKDAGLGRGFEQIYAAITAAQSEISWADWRALLDAWNASAMSARSAETGGLSPKDASAAPSGETPNA